jgi:hypothetical protein
MAKKKNDHPGSGIDKPPNPGLIDRVRDALTGKKPPAGTPTAKQVK